MHLKITSPTKLTQVYEHIDPATKFHVVDIIGDTFELDEMYVPEVEPLRQNKGEKDHDFRMRVAELPAEEPRRRKLIADPKWKEEEKEYRDAKKKEREEKERREGKESGKLGLMEMEMPGKKEEEKTDKEREEEKKLKDEEKKLKDEEKRKEEEKRLKNEGNKQPPPFTPPNIPQPDKDKDKPGHG